MTETTDEWTTTLLPAVQVPVVKVHAHSFSLARRSTIVRGKYRCTHCGHRLTVNDIPPVETRSQPVRTWHQEIIDRYNARRMYGR